MSDPVDPWKSPGARSREVSVFATGAPASPLRFVAVQWGILSLQLIVVAASYLWIASMPLRLLVMLVVMLAPLRWLSGFRPLSTQLRWQPGDRIRLSGKFRERYIPLTKAVAADAVSLHDDRLVFNVPGNGSGDPAETLSLDGRAFRRVSAVDLHALFLAVLAGDAGTLTSIARAKGLKVHERPASVAVPITEAGGMHLVAFAGTLAILITAYLLRHRVFG